MMKIGNNVAAGYQARETWQVVWWDCRPGNR